MRLFLAVCMIFVSFSASASAGEYRDVEPGRSLKFPEDFFYRKDFRLQWWYFTGHLADAGGREFGYELTFFVAGVQKRNYRSKFGVNNIYITHFAVSDIEAKKFYFSDKSDSGAFDFAGAAENRLKVWVGGDVLEGSTARMHITASDGEKAIDLILTPAKPLVLQGDRGYSRKSGESPLMASYYFSYTDLKTEGRLSIGERRYAVTGRSWFDREMTSRGLGREEAGWDWFSIQIDGDREIMLYLIRKTGGTISRYSSGTLVYPDGSYRHLSVNDFSVTVLDHYKSEKTGARYPSRWEVSVPSESLTLKITPLIRDQEFTAASSTGNYYWEGDCSVAGTAQGRAYVEMTGY
jgi:predicted secreted hydrolase